MIKSFFKRLFTTRDWTTEAREEYLAEAHDLVDLERRMRQLDRGQAPWQVEANNNLKGWT